MNRPRRILKSALTLSLVAGGAGALAATPTFAELASATTNSITTVAGNGTAGYSGDGGAAVNAELNVPTGVAQDLSGNLYIADSVNNRIRKIAKPTTLNQDLISTYAGNGTRGYSGDGGPATSAELNTPTGVAVDGSGNLFIADTGNGRVREVTSAGTIKTVAGNSSSCSKTLGDGGQATSASLCLPVGVAVKGTNLYISDTGHFEVRVVNLSTGVINDFAGNGKFGYKGDGGKATSAELETAAGVATDSLGNVYIADSAATVVRKVSSSGSISTFAGTGSFGYSGDGGAATKAKLNGPTGVGVDSSNNVYISDTLNNRIRQVSSGGTISTYAGNGTRGFSGDGGTATSAELNTPTGNATMMNNTLYFSDSGNERVRGVFNGPPPILPEVQWAILLPLGAIVLLGGGLLVVRRNRRRIRHATV